MDGFQVSGQLDVGPPGNIEDAAADFMEYMAFAYKVRVIATLLPMLFAVFLSISLAVLQV